MRVHVHRDANLGVAEQFLHHLGVDTETQQQGGCTMAQIVETNVWQSRFHEQLFKLIDYCLYIEPSPFPRLSLEPSFQLLIDFGASAMKRHNSILSYNVKRRQMCEHSIID